MVCHILHTTAKLVIIAKDAVVVHLSGLDVSSPVIGAVGELELVLVVLHVNHG
jgi:hypothetical protein